MKILKATLSHRTHRKLDIKSLIVGEVLVFDVYIKHNDDYLVIIKASTELSDELYKKLEEQESLYISVADEYKKDFNSKSLIFHVQYNKNNFEQVLYYLYKINAKVFVDFFNSKEQKINTSSLEDIVKSIIFMINSNPKYLQKTIPYFNDDNELEYHALHVAICALCLGSLLDFNDKELLQIGMAGLLHDLGIKTINESIINKESKLSSDELETMQLHIKYSTDIAKKNKIHDPYILDAIMNHHEAQDGSGYPNKIQAKDITPFASILSIADSFDALTSIRAYRKKHTIFEALTLMMKDSSIANKFNQKYLKIFLRSLIK